jgi:hypothetical protein
VTAGRWMFGVAFAIALSPARVEAQSSVATSAAIGAAAGARAGGSQAQDQPLAPPPLLGRELEDWKDPRTGASAHLFDECSTLMELRLSTTGSRNYLWMKLENAGAAPIVVRPNLVRAKVGVHPWRRMVSPQGFSHQLVQPGWRTWLLFQFHDKEEFAGARTVDVELPLENDQGQRCGIRAHLARPEQVPEDAATSVVHTKLGVWLALGTGLGATGGFDRLGGADLGLEIGFEYYPWLHHGFFFDLFGEFYRSFDTADFASRIPAFGKNPRVGGVGPFVGYLLRLEPTSWLPVSFGAGAGPYVVDVGDQDHEGSYFEEVFFASMLRANVDGFFATLPDGSRFAVRLSSYALAVPDGDFGPIELSGVSFGAMFGILVAE